MAEKGTGKASKKSKAKSARDKIIDAAIELSTEGQWSIVELCDIADKAGVQYGDAYELFDDKTDILAAYDRRVNRRAIEATALGDDLPCRDKLFDLVMERLEIINEERVAILNIMNSFKGDPKEALLSTPHLGKSMSHLLTAAGIKTNGLSGAMRVAGMTGLYLYVIKTWKNDDSVDMGKTMATLEKALDKCEMFNNSILNKMPI